MAPRTAKSKKVADVKVTETDVPKKGKGRGKTVEAEVEDITTDISEKAPVTETRAKRGKRAANDTEQVDNKSEEIAPPTKKGRKKVADAYEKSSNGDQSADEMSNQAEDDQSEENGEANGHLIESSSTEGGKKKPAKKELVSEKTEAKLGRGRKKQEKADINESPKEAEEKPKNKGKGRTKAQPKVENETEENDGIDDVVKDKPSKGRKKGPSKVKAEKKEKAELSDKDEQDDEKELEDKPVDEPKKKEPRGKKNQGKKAPLKDEEENEAEKDDASVTKRRKVTKKDDKAKVESKDEEAEGEEVIDTKPSKSKRGQKKAIEASTETDEEPQDTGEPITKRRRKVAEEKASIEDTKKPPPKNKSTTNYEQLDFSNSSKNDNGKEWNFKISSWNVDGIRAWASKGGLDYLKHEKPDILCLQETKCSQDKLPDEVVNLPGYHAYWLAGEKDGYAGVGIYTTNLAMNVQYGLQNEELDGEGRIITAEYEQFYLVNTYVPNSGRKLVTLPKRLQWNEEFRKYIKELDKKKPVIICGDMNVSHKEIDLANPKTNRKNAGFTDEERAGMTELLGEGFVDTFRHLNPDKTAAYTFWTYMNNSRARNVGWRLDYFIVSERMLPFLCDNVIRDQVYGSDHCPITLYLHLSTADKPKDQ